MDSELLYCMVRKKYAMEHEECTLIDTIPPNSLYIYIIIELNMVLALASTV